MRVPPSRASKLSSRLTKHQRAPACSLAQHVQPLPAAAAPGKPEAAAQPQRMLPRRRCRAPTQLYTMYLGVALNFWYPLITCHHTQPCQAM